MTTPHRFIATCPKAVEGLLAEELRALGAEQVAETQAAVTFEGPLSLGYRACLWSRLASRILLPLAEFPAATTDELYEGVYAVSWGDHLSPDGTLGVRATGRSSGLTHTQFVERRVKDAVVDQLRELTGRRPSVDLEQPSVRLHVRLRSERATLSLDLAGQPLHRRGYRTQGMQVEAPLKENLAAAILLRAGWPDLARSGAPLVDPMCGSGTLLIEGALMAADRAPGLLRGYWGFDGWLGHDQAAWDALLDEADERAEAAGDLPWIAGWDHDPRAVALAGTCVKSAGLSGTITIERGELSSFDAGAGSAGLVVTNPPHGIRLGESDELRGLYESLGARLRERFGGWTAAVFTPEPELARATGLRAHKRYSLYNARVQTTLYLMDIHESRDA